MKFTNDIWFQRPPKSGKILKINYSGKLYQENSSEVYIVYGYGENWDKTTEQKMNKTSRGFTYNILMENYNTFNFCFKNENNIWDNNNSFNYITTIQAANTSTIMNTLSSEESKKLVEDNIDNIVNIVDLDLDTAKASNTIPANNPHEVLDGLVQNLFEEFNEKPVSVSEKDFDNFFDEDVNTEEVSKLESYKELDSMFNSLISNIETEKNKKYDLGKELDNLFESTFNKTYKNTNETESEENYIPEPDSFSPVKTNSSPSVYDLVNDFANSGAKEVGFDYSNKYFEKDDSIIKEALATKSQQEIEKLTEKYNRIISDISKFENDMIAKKYNNIMTGINTFEAETLNREFESVMNFDTEMLTKKYENIMADINTFGAEMLSKEYAEIMNNINELEMIGLTRKVEAVSNSFETLNNTNTEAVTEAVQSEEVSPELSNSKVAAFESANLFAKIELTKLAQRVGEVSDSFAKLNEAYSSIPEESVTFEAANEFAEAELTKLAQKVGDVSNSFAKLNETGSAVQEDAVAFEAANEFAEAEFTKLAQKVGEVSNSFAKLNETGSAIQEESIQANEFDYSINNINQIVEDIENELTSSYETSVAQNENEITFNNFSDSFYDDEDTFTHAGFQDVATNAVNELNNEVSKEDNTSNEATSDEIDKQTEAFNKAVSEYSQYFDTLIEEIVMNPTKSLSTSVSNEEVLEAENKDLVVDGQDTTLANGATSESVNTDGVPKEYALYDYKKETFLGTVSRRFKLIISSLFEKLPKIFGKEKDTNNN